MIWAQDVADRPSTLENTCGWETFEELALPHIFLGIPTFRGDIAIECLVSVFRLQDWARATNGPRISLSWITGCPIDMARNILVARFLRNESATHLLFIDDDIGFQPTLVERLLKENQPVTAAFCPHRSIDLKSIAKVASDSAIDLSRIGSIAASYVAAGNIEHNNGRFEPTSTGFVKVSSIGTGVMLIERGVFGKLREAFPDLMRQGGEKRYKRHGIESAVHTPFLPMIDDNGTELGEDISFCRRWTSIGGEIWASIDDEVTHVGRIAVRGRLRDQLDHFGGLASSS